MSISSTLHVESLTMPNDILLENSRHFALHICRRCYTLWWKDSPIGIDHVTLWSAVDNRFFLRWWIQFDEGRKDHTTIFGPQAKRHLNGVSLACRWWPYIECWLEIFVVFKGIRTSIAKKPYIFVIFQGSPDPLPPSGSAHDYSCFVYGAAHNLPSVM